MRNQNLAKLAELIRQQNAELMHLWRNKVQRVSVVRNLDTPEAASHIAALLEDVAAALLKGKNKPLVTLPVDEATEVHGLQRFHQGFNLIEVVADYNALREAIQEFAEANQITVTGRVRAILDRVLDKAIGVAVQTYSEQKALEIQRQREEHLSFIVHDLKTPLSAVSTAAIILDRTLSGQCKNERVTRMLEIVQRNTERLHGLISRVIQEQTTVQRTGAESVFAARVEKRHFDLWPLIEELIQDLQPLTEPKRIRVTNDVPPDRSIFADPVLIGQVFQNLLSNAIEYTTDGDIVIGSAVSERDRTVRCWVRDTGKGIPEERLGKVFDKLETDPEKEEGRGLGLAIVKQVVEAHGGLITVVSQLGSGTKFEFTLPLQDPTGAPMERGNGTAA
ncbi:MAG: two-component sensor histidine kinase [Acidobacteria bacterium]|nr:MAG: two-component sensor histidine kinase [Acidobacteriota bacterium]